MKKNLVIKMIKIFVVIVVTVGVFSGMGYFGVKLWAEYADLLSPEEKAAVITGIFGFITVTGSMIASAIFHFQSQKITLRDELIKKRLEVYSELYSCCCNLLYAAYDFIHEPKNDLRIELKKEADKLEEYLDKNRFYLSEKVYYKASSFRFLSSCLTFPPDEEILWKGVFKRLGLENEIVLCQELSDRFHEIAFLPLLVQLDKELGLKSIEREIRKTYRGDDEIRKRWWGGYDS